MKTDEQGIGGDGIMNGGAGGGYLLLRLLALVVRYCRGSGPGLFPAVPVGAEIRDGAGPRPAGQPCQFSERFLQILWNERHLAADLHCEDGRALKVVSPGVWNVGRGPDFSQAALLFDNRLQSGDVEIHCRASDWERHGHQQNPAYAQVILHVVWEDDAPPRPGLATLVLKDNLHPAWERLLWEMEDACYPYCRQVPSGACALRWALSEDARVKEILTAAGLARFTAKGVRLARLAAGHGADQALYEAVFECLGYKNNRVPFRRLAESVELERLRRLPEDRDREAMLFGMAGLLPDPTCQPVLPVWSTVVRDYWDRWWALGTSRLELPWDQAMTRPYNSPSRRLAAGIDWLRQAKYEPAAWLRQCSRTAATPKALRRALCSYEEDDSPWRACRDFGHAIRPAAALLGKSRCLDLAANVFLPYLGAVLDMDSSPDAAPEAERVRQAFMQLPPAQGNRLLTEAAHRFLIPPSRTRELLKTCCQQQGLMDIYQNFCQALDHNCELCPFVSGDMAAGSA
jgi:hypothetical protein